MVTSWARLRSWHRRITRALAVVLVITVIVTVVIGVVAPGVNGPRVDGRMQHLMSLSEEQRAEYVKSHAAETVAYLNLTPLETAEWWTKRSMPDQGDVVTVLPEYVGNLEGIDYTSRDLANRKQLQKALVTAKHAVSAHPSSKATMTLASLTAIKSSISGHHSPHRYLIALTADEPPLAAVSVGNLDTAAQVTFNVPGMGTFTNDMQTWTQSAQNVWEVQLAMGAPQSHAVVAWIGYVTPPVGVDAALGGYAASGAPLLTSAIEGFHAARGPNKPAAVSVIAHSYGATTAANAIADADLDLFAFVRLGAAGVEPRINSVKSLNASHIYAGEAKRDVEARWGQVARHDPRVPSFGAKVLSVDGDTELQLHAVTGHAPVLHSKWNDNVRSPLWSRIKSHSKRTQDFALHLNSFGYLDMNTESLRNAAIATTPDSTQPMTDGE